MQRKEAVFISPTEELCKTCSMEREKNKAAEGVCGGVIMTSKEGYLGRC